MSLHGAHLALPRFSQLPRRTTKFTTSLRDIGRESSSYVELPPSGWGPPLYLVLGTRQIVTMNFWYWMMKRYLQTTSIVATGGKNGGKTAHIKILIYLLLMLSQGGERCRAIYDNMRDDFDTAEDQYMFNLWGDKAGRIVARSALINPYHHMYGLSSDQMLRWTLTTISDMTGERLTGYQITILSQMIRKMVTFLPEYSSPLMLVQMIAEYDVDYYEDEISAGFDQLKERLGSSADHILETVMRPESDGERQTVFRYAKEQIRRDAAALADILHRVLLGGLSGQVFGNENSLMDIMKDKVYVSQDLTDLDPALAASYHYFARMITGQMRFDVIGQDETSINWRYLSWALASSNEEWQIRGQSPIIMRIIQELALLKTTGDLGSQQRELAEASVRGAGLHLIHPGQSEASYKELQDMLGFSNLDLAWLQSLDPDMPGILGIKARGQGRGLLKVQLDPTSDFEWDLIASNASLRRRLQAYYDRQHLLESAA